MERLLPLAEHACLAFVEGGKRWYLDSPVDSRSRGESAFLAALRAVESRYAAGGSRDNRAICGFSMGGFGAMYLAARHPDLFASASSILGPLDIEPLCPDYPGLRALLGDDPNMWREYNPAAHVAALRNVRLLVTTGDEAWDRPMGRRFVEACRARGILAAYRQQPGAHDVGFVAAQLEPHLAFHLNAGPAWRIRRARPDDADALARNCFSKSAPDDVARDLEWSLAEAAHGRRVHLVVELGEAVANGELSIMGDRAKIVNLVVEGSLQGHGLGTALIRALTGEASARGISTSAATTCACAPCTSARDSPPTVRRPCR
jgi:GNAT superfamily N-acetyltransferase